VRTVNERDQPIRLTLWIGARQTTVALRGTVWGAHERPPRRPEPARSGAAG
jgi:hypothetical protein